MTSFSPPRSWAGPWVLEQADWRQMGRSSARFGPLQLIKDTAATARGLTLPVSTALRMIELQVLQALEGVGPPTGVSCRAPGEELGQLWLGAMDAKAALKLLESSGVKSTGFGRLSLGLRAEADAGCRCSPTGFVHHRVVI